mgnify:CR=1 FL=1
MSKRNWVAIAQLSDTYTRVAISLAKGEILACYERGFPHLFIEGDDDGSLCVPLSALKEAAFEYARKNTFESLWEYDSNFLLAPLAEEGSQIEIPIAFEWRCSGDCGLEPPPIPDGIVEQLIGQKVQAGMKIMYCGKQYMVYTIVFRWHDRPQVGSTLEYIPELDYLSLVDANFVALDK